MHLNQKELNNSVPDDKFALAGEYRQKRWSVGMDIVAAFNTHADSLGTPVILDDYVVANTHGIIRLTRNLRLKLAVDNLFDTKYETVSGYPMPGINFRTGLAVTFE
ncbi:MAG: TonB-dependent receptor [Candidatus Zixiibacteriota bacterium]|nr:MAG: TonB-dependent receptor [candidate division Zixibacteria bacterium]